MSTKHFVSRDEDVDFDHHVLNNRMYQNGHSINDANNHHSYPQHHQFHSHDHPTSRLARFLDRFFKISERGSTIKTEIRGGLVTFVTMAYILVVNPEVLSKGGTAKDPFAFDDIAVSTALSAAIGSALVGVFGNLPFGLAPGMGLNSYFTYGVCIKLGLSWRVALSTVFFQGVLFFLLAASGACSLIQLYAPPCIKKSITVGLGLFQALIGFECMQLVVRGDGVLLALGDMSSQSVWLGIFGLMLICILLVLNVKGAMLVGMVVVTFLSWAAGLSPYPSALVQLPSLSHTFFALDFQGFFIHYHITLPVCFVFLFVSIFDTAGVQFAAGQQAGLLDEQDHLPGSTAAFCGAGISTSFGALMGTSPVIIHNETCAGIQDGARTGLAAVTVSFAFLLSLPFIPILRAVPPIATAAPLVIVGMFMMSMSKFIDWESVDEAMPAFLTATILPLTYSIANGMIAGLVAYVILKTAAYFVPHDAEHDDILSLTKHQNGIPDPVPGTPKPMFLRQGSSTSSPPINGIAHAQSLYQGTINGYGAL